jgi:hypothetical protein
VGNNEAAVDEAGAPLVWDQRGNGDPRFVAGVTDIGAFENQGVAWLVVDTEEDSVARACTRGHRSDCSLRGAMTIANAMGKEATIRFDPGVFAERGSITVGLPLPALTVAATLNGDDAGGVELRVDGDFDPFLCSAGGKLMVKGVVGPDGVPWAGCDGSGQ